MLTKGESRDMSRIYIALQGNTLQRANLAGGWRLLLTLVRFRRKHYVKGFVGSLKTPPAFTHCSYTLIRKSYNNVPFFQQVPLRSH